MRRLFLLVLVTGALMAGQARAATSSISVSSGTLVFASQVTFSVSAIGNQQPWLENTCFQNGIEVLDQTDVWGMPGWGSFTLGPTDLWSGGAADCTAYILKVHSNGDVQRTASVSYSVSP